MGNPYAQRVAPPALKRKASPTKVGRAAVAERELQALEEKGGSIDIEAGAGP